MHFTCRKNADAVVHTIIELNTHGVHQTETSKTKTSIPIPHSPYK